MKYIVVFVYLFCATILISSEINISDKIKQIKSISQPHKKLVQIDSLDISTQNNYAILIIKIQSYLQLKDFGNALKYAKKLVKLYPKSQEAQDMLRNIKKWKKDFELKNKKESMVGIGTKHYIYLPNRDTKDQIKYLELSSSINSYNFYMQILNKQRYNLVDNSLEVEFYLHQDKPYWAFLNFGATSSADFSSKYFIGWYQYIVQGSWQFGTSYKYTKYPTTYANTITLEYAYYFTDYLDFKQTVYYSLPTKSDALLTELRYKSPTHLQWYISYTISNSNELLEKSDSILSTDGLSWQGGIEYPFLHQLSLGCDLNYDKNSNKNNSFTKKGINIFIRKYW